MNHPAEIGVSLSMAEAPVVIRPYTPADKARWDEFVMGCPNATFFHRAGWRAIIEGVFGHRAHYLIAERGDDVVGVLPLAQVRSLLFGHSLQSLPFCVYGGCASMDHDAISKLHAYAVKLAKGMAAEHLELRNREMREPVWAQQDLYVTFRREIATAVEANMTAIPRKQRAMVRKGIKAGLASEIDESVERFFALYADNVHRHGTPPFPKRYFSELKRVFGPDCEVLTVVDASKKPVSSVLSFYFRDEVLPYYAGDLVEARDLAANDFKYWELMRRACERGVRIFDFGRSKRGTGSFAFKTNWGFEPTPLSYEYALLKRGAIPQHNPLNPKYRALIALWKRLPRSAANALGPILSRHLG
jgi:FemAB-related protein (PEP-CTERM system-associated)